MKITEKGQGGDLGAIIHMLFLYNYIHMTSK